MKKHTLMRLFNDVINSFPDVYYEKKYHRDKVVSKVLSSKTEYMFVKKLFDFFLSIKLILELIC